ncbi:MAG: hypothetical protein OEX81_01090 [Candidatus Pacebacteria bacterium]|nr:hypothetical protein [Candidatus Paceibacterota bacterium]
MSEKNIQDKYNEAVELYHSDAYLEALKLFEEIIDNNEGTNSFSSQIWKASCLVRLEKFEQALEVITKVIDHKELSLDIKKRALRVLAFVYTKTHEFKKAFLIYDQLVKDEVDPRDLEYLQHLIDTAQEEFDYYIKYGSLSAWKKQIRDEIKTNLKKVDLEMKTIYSPAVLQRILDSFGVGRIKEAESFLSIGKNSWIHFIKTNQGEFELFSFPTYVTEDEQLELLDKRLERFGYIFEETIHRFDRYHQLVQKTRLTKISPKQIIDDFELLKDQKIKDLFRVTGTIIHFNFENDSTIWSYGLWSLQHKETDKDSKVLIDSYNTPGLEIEDIIEELQKKNLEYKSFILKDDWFELYFSDGYSFHFKADYEFPAIEYLFFRDNDNSIQIFSEQEIYYSKEIVGE